MLGLDVDLSFDPPITVFNLSGGVSCMSGSNGTCWLTLPGPRGVFWTTLQPATAPHPLNYLAPLKILTRTHFNRAEELHDPLESSSLYLANASGISLENEQSARWIGFSIAYRSRRDTLKARWAERIDKQILFCRNTLDALIRSYRSTLTSNLLESEICYPEVGTFRYTENKYSTDIGYRAQSCLNELYALRDLIMSFLFEGLYGQKVSLSRMNDFINSDDRFGFASTILPLFSRDVPIGKIALMSIYRNVFFHYTGPRSGPFGPMYCFRENYGPLGLVPYLVYPLYDDIDRLKLIERGKYLDNDSTEVQKQEAIRFMQLSSHLDVLDLCYECFVILLMISELIEKQIPLKSENVVLTDKDILDLTLHGADGQVKKYKQNKDGKLEQY
jgi:hypothetical protein